ncbi:class E sortase [Streptomyces sp. NPDC127106]|uniref:class E sortase n=1 Tax=Streptomyces sp. NPDC127106 TaxID=3345360 RepID=UPI003625231B
MRVVVHGRGAGSRRAGLRGLRGLLWVTAELAVTVGVVVLLLVVHQVWWTNRLAAASAQRQVAALERGWAEERRGGGPGAGDGAGGLGESASASAPAPAPASASPPSPSPSVSGSSPGSSPSGSGSGGSTGSSAYGVLRIPRLGVVVPIAQGVDKRAVLDKGYAGHYPGTARPGAEGNFALAGHRNTHGEPFRYINRLRPGDELVVEVQGRTFTYVVRKTLAETSERDVGVIAPVPRSAVRPEYGFGEPGAYITLTTCTPEYSSTYRLVVWGTLVRAATG